jgi:arabinogalactan endo-1,4-beta-galactosidase
MGCQYIKAGKLKIERDGKKDAVVDYGDGTCDDKATVKIGNRSKDITLRKW